MGACGDAGQIGCQSGMEVRITCSEEANSLGPNLSDVRAFKVSSGKFEAIRLGKAWAFGNFGFMT